MRTRVVVDSGAAKRQRKNHGAAKRQRKNHGAAKLRLRFRVLERDGFRCHYCGVPAREMHLQIDHVMPFSKGGADDPSNYVASCSNCNGGKGDVILGATE